MNSKLILIIILFLAGCLARDDSNLAEKRPNLLFIITDDQRFDMLGVVNPVLETPNMDRLATEGVRFENAFVTTPICAASRASLLAGVVERTHRYTFGTPPLATEFVDGSYPVLLREAGYRTGFIGKFGVNTAEGATDRMFDVFDRLPPGAYFREDKDGLVRHLTDITTDSAIDFLRSADPDTPFSLTLSFNAPHAVDNDERQYIWPEAMNEKYVDITIPDPPLSEPAFYESLPTFLKDDTLNRVRWHWRFDTPEKAQQMTKGYFRMISGVDAGIGRILEELASLDLADNTVIVLMGDNGYFLGERGYAGKWLPYDLSIRVPLVILDPRSEINMHGLTPTAPALNIDLPPTLLDLAGVSIPPEMQGKSLLPILQGKSPGDWRTDFFVEHLFNHPQIPKHEGVRNERFKYARYFEQVPVYEELYDLRDDPMETRNLVADPVYADVLSELQARTDNLRDAYGGPFSEGPSRPDPER